VARALHSDSEEVYCGKVRYLYQRIGVEVQRGNHYMLSSWRLKCIPK
jgi:hypothetical protein